MIKIDCDIFHFESCDHINILGARQGLIFDSGSRKTFLFRSLQSQQNLGRMQSNGKVRLVDSPYTLSGIRFTSKDCVIIDELNFAPREIDALLMAVRKANAYLIVIGRILIKQLEYSVDAIYTFSYDSGKFYVERYFSNVSQQPFHADTAVCEDSTSVAAVYSQALEQEVIPACGRSNFFRYVKQKEIALVIADKPKFGPDLLNLIYRARTSGCRLRYLLLFLPACFEEIVCEVSSAMVSETKVSEEYDFFDEEQYYEYLAEKKAGWDKENVTKAVAGIVNSFHLESSAILRDLRIFYQGGTVGQDMRCYVCDIAAVDISQLQPVICNVGNDII